MKNEKKLRRFSYYKNIANFEAFWRDKTLAKTNYKIIFSGVNHPKLEAFQKAVEATLKKRLQQAEEELDFLRKENVDKKQGRAQQTTALHETQRLLKLEQRKLKKVSEETQIITKGGVFSKQNKKNSSNHSALLSLK